MTPFSTNTWKTLSSNGQFRWLFAGNTALFFGFFATVLLRSLLAWDLTGDEMSLAYINLVSAGCMLVMSLFSGAIIDRFERRRLLAVAQMVVLVAESIILALLLTGQLTFGLLLISSVAASIAFPFIMPARTAMLVDAVGKPSLRKATALISAGINVARMTSPAIVGITADIAGMVYSYAFLLVVHGISLLCTLRLRDYPAGNTLRQGFMRETAAGFAYIVRKRSLGLAILFGILPMLIVMPLQNLMVVFVDDVWQAGGSGLGIMMAAMGVGGLLGSVVMGMLGEGSLVKPMVIGTLFMALFLVLFSHSPVFWVAVVMVVGIYTSSVFSQTLVHTSVQLMAEDHIRGRITTITMMSMGVAPMGTLALAFAVKRLGPTWAMTAAAVLLACAVLLFWRLLPSFRAIDRAARP